MEPDITWSDVLGAVPNAETRTIKRKYEDKAPLLRPELISGPPPNVLTAVTRAQHMLDTAWEVLGDPDGRKRYHEAIGLAEVPASCRAWFRFIADDAFAFYAVPTCRSTPRTAATRQHVRTAAERPAWHGIRLSAISPGRCSSASCSPGRAWRWPG